MFLLSFWVRVFLVWICLWFLRIFSQFRPESALEKFASSKGRFFAKNFRERTFVFASFWALLFFDRVLPMVFAYFFAISPRKRFRKIRFLSGLVFCLVLSVLGSGLRFSVRFCFFSSFSFFFPLSSLGVGLGLSLFFFPPLCLQDWRGRRRQVLRCVQT